jgi:hypothetical protein
MCLTGSFNNSRIKILGYTYYAPLVIFTGIEGKDSARGSEDSWKVSRQATSRNKAGATVSPSVRKEHLPI